MAIESQNLEQLSSYALIIDNPTTSSSMNLSLLDPFSALKEYPEHLTHTLSFGHAVFLRYNQHGDYLASGLANGTILIIDNDTKSVIRRLKGHVRAIQSLCWSSDGRFLLSGSRDWQCKVWDLSDSTVLRTFKFNGPIWNCEFNPKHHQEFIVSVHDDLPKFVNAQNMVSDLQADLEERVLVSSFHPSGELIFTGTNKGLISIISRKDLEVIFSDRLTASGIKSLVFSSNGRKLAVNSADRIIRQIDLPDFTQDPTQWKFEVDHKFQDLVNRIQWNSILFSANAEHLIASAFGSSHDIYIWETSMGSLIKILEGPKEELVDIEWNYRKCVICATGLDSGTIYMWSVVVPQKWSALAPDFVEIEQNIDYIENEDEFDIDPTDELNQKQLDEEDEVVDILSREAVDARGFEVKKSFVIPISYNTELNGMDGL